MHERTPGGRRILSRPGFMSIALPVPDRARALLLVALAAGAVSCGRGQTEAISGKAGATEASVAPTGTTTTSAADGERAPLSAEALDVLRRRADERKIPDKSGEACPALGVRPTSQTAVVICSEAGSKSYAVECKGPSGIFSMYGAAACDIRGNAAGDPCALVFSRVACVGRAIIECAPDGLEPFRPPPAFPRGRVATKICEGPRGCYTEIDEGLGGVEVTECDEASTGR